MKPPLKSINLNFADLDFYRDFVIAVLKEDIVFGPEQVRDVTSHCLDFFNGRKFVYISNRRHSYSVQPTIYFNLNNAKYLTGIAIICRDPRGINVAKFEKGFSKLPFGIFTDPEDAVDWAKETVKKKRADL